MSQEEFHERLVELFNSRWIICVGWRGDSVRGIAINRSNGARFEYRFAVRDPTTTTIGPHIVHRRGSNSVMVSENKTKIGKPGRAARWKLKQMMISLRET